MWNSKNEHGVHSPFVYDLVTKCFYDKKGKPEYTVIKKYRKTLLQNKNTIEVTDFGAGSRVFKSNTRIVSQIVTTAGISPKRAELLLRMVQYFQPEQVLEIGTSLGMATVALASGNPKAKITSLEGCPETAKVALEHFGKFHFKNITLITTEFGSYLRNLQPTTQNPQLVYFDGNHSRAATLAYFEFLLPTITNDSIWIFDDIHWSTDMEAAWEIIQNHPRVTVTIDTFQWGLVFFRTQQMKEHFVIRL